MITNCPTCGKEVDTLRARAVSVRDGKVIAFCSQECKAAAETRPVAVPVAPAPVPAAPVPVKSATGPVPKVDTGPVPKVDGKKGKKKGPVTDESAVIEITHEPASGVVTSAPDRRDGDAKAVSTPSASAAGSTTIPEDTKKQKKTRPDPPADPDRVPEIKRESPKASDGKATPIAGFKLNEFKEYKPTDAEKPKRPPPVADTDEADVEVAPPPKGSKRAVILLLVLLVAGGGIVVVYKLMTAKASNAATRAEAPVVLPPSPAKPEAPPAPPPPSAADALAAAKAELAKDVAATPKVAVAAAAALARTGDPAALAALTKLLPQQTSDIGKLVVAYDLARGGYAKGRELLAADLAVDDRERRLEAARALARLGDPRATASLLNYIDYPQFHMTIAVLLAEETRDPKAVKALDDIVADPKATADDKVRATIALAVADFAWSFAGTQFYGRPELTGKLHDLLADNRFNAEAAAALARRHDEAARPVLEAQLGVGALRVSAARSLRTLDPARDLAALLPQLVDGLGNSKDALRIVAAETILILAGDAAWSAYE